MVPDHETKAEVCYRVIGKSSAFLLKTNRTQLSSIITSSCFECRYDGKSGGSHPVTMKEWQREMKRWWIWLSDVNHWPNHHVHTDLFLRVINSIQCHPHWEHWGGSIGRHWGLDTICWAETQQKVQNGGAATTSTPLVQQKTIKIEYLVKERKIYFWEFRAKREVRNNKWQSHSKVGTNLYFQSNTIAALFWGTENAYSKNLNK